MRRSTDWPEQGHAGGCLSRKDNDASTTRHPRPTPDLYGRWLWRGGSTRSHPELGSENPLRGWYCRGHPVGEYGAAGLSLKTHARFEFTSRRAWVFLRPQAFTEGSHAETQRKQRELQPRFSPFPLRLCVKRSVYQ